MDYKKIPKIELHCHLDGCLRADTVKELLKSDKSIDEVDNMLRVKEKVDSLATYLKKFDLPQIIMQSYDNIKRITFEVLEDMEAENVKYVELRFAPLFHLDKGLTPDRVIEAVIDGINDAEERYNIRANIIIIGMRHHSEEENFKLIEIAKNYLGNKVVAYDIAGDEESFPPEMHKNEIAKAMQYGFKITMHAGETGKYKNIDTSINLGATRIGHGIATLMNENTLKLVKDKNIFLEVCPTSNLNTNIVDDYINHPIKELIQKGIKVTISTDNRTVSNTTMTKEIKHVFETFKLEEKDYKNIYLNSVEAAFCTDELKEKLKEYIKG